MTKSNYLFPIPKVTFYSGLGVVLASLIGFCWNTQMQLEQLKAQQNYNTAQIENRFKNDDKVDDKLNLILTEIADLKATMKYKEDKKGIDLSFGGNSNGNSCK